MKKLFVLLFVLVLSSCTASGREERFFCKKLGFDSVDGKIYITTLIATPEKESGKWEEKIMTRVATDVKEAKDILESELGNVVFKPLEEIIFGYGVEDETIFELMAFMANRVDFQLKCKVYKAFQC